MRLYEDSVATYRVGESGHQLIVENVFVQMAAARSCEEDTNEKQRRSALTRPSQDANYDFWNRWVRPETRAKWQGVTMMCVS